MSEKKFDLGSYAEDTETVDETVYKPLQYINMPKCFQDAIGLPGIPLGHSTMLYGLSDSGKTDVLLKIAREAVSQEILPIIIITENKMEKARLESMGLKDKENCIVVEHLTTLEDVYDYISMKCTDIKNGKLKMNTMILWDSVAGTPSKDSFEIAKDGKITKKYGPQKNASVIGYYNPIVMKIITSTRQIDCDYSLGLFMLNQAYKNMPEFPGAPVTTVPNGGEKIWFPISLAIEIKEGKRIKVTQDGRDLEIGLVSKLKVKKNHVTGVNSMGEIVLAGSEMFENDEKLVKEYKERFKDKK
jgi:hypothetical protein